ncbi:MAG TPA: recombination protein NinG [Methanosarcina sp.]|nr:recombination protein NinG [Methanosarcina sp.]
MRTKKCKNSECGKQFTPERNFQVCCDYDCAIAYAKQQQEKKQKKERRATLKAFNNSDKNILKRKAIQVFNAYIRKRDENLACVSCGYKDGARQIHAGHYRPAGNVAILRFDERNVHAQCSICNNHLSGNLVNYRKELINRIGLDQVEELEATNEPKQYTIKDYTEIIRTYKAKIKEL